LKINILVNFFSAIKSQKLIMKSKTENLNYNPNQEEYVVKLKKPCRWCWLLLLLLLLPLLLLIPLKKDISFKVVNSFNDAPVEKIGVNFEYTKRDLFNFDTKAFLSNYYPYPTPVYTDTTNSEGVVVFKDVKYSVYQWIFRSNDIAKVFASDECFSLDSTMNFFDLEDINTVVMQATLLDMEFTVVDADDNNEPLTDALVNIFSEMLATHDSARSDAAGKVIFKNIPLCSVMTVDASKYGWFSDTLSGDAREIYQEKDTLFLKQQKAVVKFFAKDLNTKSALVGAIGSLYLEDNPNTPIQSNIRTNVNGVGKGVFEDVHVIKKVRIDVANRPYYNDSSTVRYYSVSEWISKPEEEQSIYLRPNPNPILFKNIDCVTNQGIANVQNKVTITKGNGTTETENVVSNSAGEFSVSASMGDKISIEAVSNSLCPNKYQPNSTAISNLAYSDLKDDANKRKIPMCKDEAPIVKFRNVDAATGAGISGVSNKVVIQGGGSQTVRSGADGWFEVKNVYDCQIISIVADGSSVSYGINTSKIQNKSYATLMSASEADRTIPLEKKVEEPLQGESGELRINLQWNSSDDLDLYVTDPCGNKIYFEAVRASCNGSVGTLDVDANADGNHLTSHPQENVFWDLAKSGSYIVKVDHYQKNTPLTTVGFNVTIIHLGVRKDFSGNVNVGGETVVTTFVVP